MNGNLHCFNPIKLEELLDVVRQQLSGPHQKFALRGCTNEELNQLAQVQRVACLPDLYQELMLNAGKVGIDLIFQYSGNYEDILPLKAEALHELQEYGHGQQCPADAFFFAYYPWHEYFIFRTRDCTPDPAVYLFSFVSSHWYKAFDTFSEFLWARYLSHTRMGQKIWTWLLKIRFLNPCVFDSEANEFVPYQPKPVALPPFEQVARTFLAQFVNEPVGCTEAEIEEIMQLLEADWLPETYLHFLRLCGKAGIELLLQNANYAQLPTLKKDFLKAETDFRDKYPQEPTPLPNDLAVWGQDPTLTTFYCFRIGDRQPDPAVYVLHPSFTFLAANSLREYVFRHVAPDAFDTIPWDHRPVYYDEQRDAFLPLTKEIIFSLV